MNILSRSLLRRMIIQEAKNLILESGVNPDYIIPTERYFPKRFDQQVHPRLTQQQHQQMILDLKKLGYLFHEWFDGGVMHSSDKPYTQLTAKDHHIYGVWLSEINDILSRLPVFATGSVWENSDLEVHEAIDHLARLLQNRLVRGLKPV